MTNSPRPISHAQLGAARWRATLIANIRRDVPRILRHNIGPLLDGELDLQAILHRRYVAIPDPIAAAVAVDVQLRKPDRFVVCVAAPDIPGLEIHYPFELT